MFGVQFHSHLGSVVQHIYINLGVLVAYGGIAAVSCAAFHCCKAHAPVCSFLARPMLWAPANPTCPASLFNQAKVATLLPAGPIVVKAGIWYIVEQMHAAGISKLYAGPVSSPYQVRRLQLLDPSYCTFTSCGLAGLTDWTEQSFSYDMIVLLVLYLPVHLSASRAAGLRAVQLRMC